MCIVKTHTHVYSLLLPPWECTNLETNQWLLFANFNAVRFYSDFLQALVNGQWIYCILNRERFWKQWCYYVFSWKLHFFAAHTRRSTVVGACPVYTCMFISCAFLFEQRVLSIKLWQSTRVLCILISSVFSAWRARFMFRATWCSLRYFAISCCCIHSFDLVAKQCTINIQVHWWRHISLSCYTNS